MKAIPANKLIPYILGIIVIMGGVFGVLYLRSRPPAIITAISRAAKTNLRQPPNFLANIEGENESALRSPLGIAVDDENRILVADTENSRVLIFDQAGILVGQIGKKGGAPGEFESPNSIAVNKDRIFVADHRLGSIQILDKDGKFLDRIDGTNVGAGFAPVAVAVDDQGKIYASNIALHMIHVFSPEGRHLLSFGGGGDGDGFLNYANGLAVDAEGKVYVADSNNARIQVFDSQGKFLLKIGGIGSNVNMVVPRGLALDSAGRIYTADALGHKVFVFDNKGTPLFDFAGRGIDNGQLNFPNSLAIDRQGRILVADKGNNRVVVFGY